MLDQSRVYKVKDELHAKLRDGVSIEGLLSHQSRDLVVKNYKSLGGSDGDIVDLPIFLEYLC